MNRSFTLCATFVAALSIANAQNWVDTVPQNKKVVIEEFTGIYCTFCPDGHKIANQLIKDNPGDVYAVNIHSGGYAGPRVATDPDFRTPEGDIIDDASGLGGYPAASINRYRTPRVEPGARSTWAASVNSQLTESSAANAYVKAYYDRTTKVLTTEVEVYYTANSATDKNKVTVMLLQNNILGPQVGGDIFYPENFLGDDYIHNHVLRDIISDGGAWGEEITTTRKGDYFYKKYETTLPESIVDVPLTFYNLDVLVFVAEEDDNNIMAAYQAEVEYDPTGSVDLSLKSDMKNTDFCIDPFKPQVVVTNSSSETVTSFDLTLETNGQSYTKSFSGSIPENGTATVTFDDEIVPSGEYMASVTGFKNINGGDFFDTDLSNDKADLSGLGFQTKAFEYDKFGFNAGMDAHIGRNIKENENYVLIPTNGHTGGCIRYSIHSSWNVAGLPGELVMGEADFTNISDPEISYYYAYSDGSQGGTAPEIVVKVSEDCGATFNEVDKISCKSTGEPSNPQNFYVPTQQEYKQHKVSLADYANKSVIISVAGIPGTSGNALYIDEIEVGSSSKILNTTLPELVGVSVYPNPAKDELTVKLADFSNAVIMLTDINGKSVLTENAQGGQTRIDVSNLSNGIYMLNISSELGTKTVRVNVAH